MSEIISDPAHFLKDTEDITSISHVIRQFPMKVTEYYASLACDHNFADPVFQQYFPSEAEMINHGLSFDPFEEKTNNMYLILYTGTKIAVC